MKVLNAEGLVLGRLASYAAKMALIGEDVIIVNSEMAVVLGERRMVFERYLKRLRRKNLGNYRKGPYHQKRPDKMLRRTVRNMLPFNSIRGREAYKRIMTYIGVPREEIMRKHNVNIGDVKFEGDLIKKGVSNFVTLEDISEFIGGNF